MIFNAQHLKNVICHGYFLSESVFPVDNVPASPGKKQPGISIKVVKLALRGYIKPLQRDGIKHFQRISIKSVKWDSMKPANGGSTKNASSESSKAASSGCTDCSAQVMAQMPKLRGKSVKKLASLRIETGSGSPVTSNLSDSDVSLAQMTTKVHTDMIRPSTARLKQIGHCRPG